MSQFSTYVIAEPCVGVKNAACLEVCPVDCIHTAPEEVYGAITYYLAHTDEVHTYLKRQDELWEAWRANSTTRSSPVVARLRALRASEAPKPS